MRCINFNSKIVSVITALAIAVIGTTGCSGTESQGESSQEETISTDSEETLASTEGSPDKNTGTGVLDSDVAASENESSADTSSAEMSSISYDADEVSVSDLFDTAGQIEETVLYNDNGVTITATELVYSEENLDLMLRVENNTEKPVTILNCSYSDGVVVPSCIGEAVLYSESLGLSGAGDDLPVGTSDIALSYEMRQLIYSGIPCVPGVLTTLYLYIWGNDNDYEMYEIDVTLMTAFADDYLVGEDRFVSNTLSDEWAEAFEYTVLMSDTQKISDYCTAAALIEENGGDLVLLVEFSEDAAGMMTYCCSLSVNETTLDGAGSLWNNLCGQIYVEDSWRFVYMIGISAEDRSAYGLDDIESVSLIYEYEGSEEYITLLDLTVSTDIDGTLAIEEWTDITAISMELTRDAHCAGLKSDGTVVAYGNNENGRCNVGAWEDIIEVVCGPNFTAGLKSDGTVVAVGGIRTKDIADWTNIKHIESAVLGILIGITEEGTVLMTTASDSTDFDDINEITEWTGIEDVATNGIFAVVLMEDGEVAVTDTFYDWSDWNDIVAIDAGMNHVVAIRSDGSVIENGSSSENGDVSDWTDIVDVSAGAYSTVGVKSDGTLVVAGDLAAAEALDEIHDAVAVCAGNDHALVLHDNGTVTLESP